MTKKVIKVDEQPKSIEEMREELEKILPSKGGQTRLTIGYGDTFITIPILGEVAKEVMKKMKVKNRTLASIGSIKIGIDIS